MTKDQIISLFTSIKRGGGKGERRKYKSPHKPLLLLYILAHYWHGGDRMIAFTETDAPLKALIRRFSLMDDDDAAAMYPFFNLQHDSDIWERRSIMLWGEDNPRGRGRKKKPSYSDAAKSDLRGGLAEGIHAALAADRFMLLDVLFAVMNRYFPKHRHIELLDLLGVPDGAPGGIHGYIERLSAAMEAYRGKCAVCEFDGGIYDSTICVEVSHIKWSGAGGPDTIDNLLALCSLHRNLFNTGAFTLDGDHRIEVSKAYRPSASGAGPDHLLRFDGEKAKIPAATGEMPGGKYLAWHTRHVFI